MGFKKPIQIGTITALFAASASNAGAAESGEANIHLLSLQDVYVFGGILSSYAILYFGLAVCVVGSLFGFIQYKQTRALPVHKAMADVSNIIWETCKTYLLQQGKFLVGLWILIAACMLYYFIGLEGNSIGNTLVILGCSVLGILGSGGVAC